MRRTGRVGPMFATVVLVSGILLGDIAYGLEPVSPAPAPIIKRAVAGPDTASPSVLDVKFSAGKFSVKAENADLSVVLRKIGEAAKVRVELGPGLIENVTVKFNELNLEEALVRLVSGKGSGIVVGYDDKGAISFMKLAKKEGKWTGDIAKIRRTGTGFSPEDLAKSLSVEETRELVRDLQDESKKSKWNRLAGKIIYVRKREARPYLKELFSHRDDFIRWEATDAYCRIVDIDDADMILEMAADKRDWNLRAVSAYTAMPQIEDPRQIPVLIHLLRDGNLAVRDAAARTLGAKRSRDAVPYLEEMLKNDKEYSNRATAAQALDMITGEKHEWMSPEGKQRLDDAIRSYEDRMRKAAEKTK